MNRPDRSAPEGAHCAEHTDRIGIATCPQCGKHACLECWHGAVDRCHSCLVRNPADAAPPVPYEDGGPLGAIRTMASALHPVQTAPAFAGSDIRSAVRFALLTLLPLGALRGVIPYTHTLRFGPQFAVTVIGQRTTHDIAIDVTHALGIGLLVTAVGFLALTLPVVSLSQSYGNRHARTATLSSMLYRGWLVPVSGQGLFFGLALWGMPEDPGSIAVVLVQLLDLLPLVYLLVSMRAAARLGAGVGPIKSYLIVAVAVVVFVLGEGLLMHAISGWLPGPPPT